MHKTLIAMALTLTVGLAQAKDWAWNYETGGSGASPVSGTQRPTSGKNLAELEQQKDGSYEFRIRGNTAPRGGAATIIGWEAVAKSPADGYILLMAGISGRRILPSVATINYDPAKDLVAVTRVANSPNIFVVPAGKGPQNLKDWVAYAKTRPGLLNMGLAAPGTLTQFAGTLLQRNAGISLTEIPYKGGAPTVNALLAGEVDCMIADLGAVLPQIQSGKLTALATADRRRSPFLPQVPTLVSWACPTSTA
ncbi:Tripartite tricarboxylate transporter family receptor [Pseudacidovorax sp. RU35E]|nr:Tripartite tricarboxylate transporter family receptor [Pseudacidovorax sp. RU35E]